MSFRRLSASRAFTLIELLVVIVIIAILMAIAIPAYLSQQTKAQDQAAKQHLAYAYRSMRAALTSSGQTDAFPAPAALASEIQSDNPGSFSVTTGNCLGATSPTTIVIDSVASGATKAYAYAKSKSGSVWRMNAPLTDVQSFTKLGNCSGALSPATVLTSGNELTDATRKSAVQGDGLAAESSVGVWENSTNTLPNGGGETNATGWFVGGVGSGSVARTTSASKFGSASIALTITAGTPSAYIDYIPGGAVAAGTYTDSMWFKAPAGDSVKLQLWELGGAAGNSAASNGTVTATGDWQRLTTTKTLLQADRTSLRAELLVNSATVGDVIYVDGAQLEAKANPTPYIETNGGAANRNTPLVRYPAAGILNATQGWVAMRVRMGWATAERSYMGSNPGRFWAWGGFQELQLYPQTSYNGQICITRNSGNAGAAGACSAATPWARGQIVTLVAAWDANGVKVSRDGGAFVSSAGNGIPALGAYPNFEIGSMQGGVFNDSEYFWFLAGSGTLTDSDASTIANFGATDPLTQDLPATAATHLAWGADTAAAFTG